MPIYNFKCQKCSKVSNLLIYSGDIPECEHCKSRDLEKLPSRVAFRTGSSSGGQEHGSPGSSCSSCSTHNCSTCH